jgi:hypothetical protein
MEIDPKMSAALGDFKTQLEKISGTQIEASADQLAFFSFPVGSAFYEENSQITSRFVVLPGKFCTTPRTLLDATGRTSTGADGKRVFRLSDFICSSLNSFSEPVFLLATPKTATPCYITLTHQLIKDPNNPNSFNDVEITAFTWKPGGEADPNIAFDWRCRVVSNPIIL